MNSLERDQLNQLLKQLGEISLTTRDTEAESLIRETAARQPDATYLLVQRTMLLEQALNGAKARIDDLQSQLLNSQPVQKNNFLSNDPWAQPTASNVGTVPGAGNYQVPRNAAQQQQQLPTAASSFGVGSSFLGNMATTAAGVVAGSFLFHGIENLMGHHSSGLGQQSLNEHVPEQNVVNNYYGDDAKQLADNKDDDTHNDYLASNDDDSFQDESSDSDWA